jgi:hypothetical protein
MRFFLFDLIGERRRVAILDGVNGVADEHRLDETQFVVAVGKRLGIDRARRHANHHAEN